MKVTGIIAEYNPFHNGHKYQIEAARKNGADYIIVAMSGDFTQRGEPAIFDKYTRAEMALKNGADLVIELPVIYATSDAGRFAYGGVSILNSLGVVNELCFGIEPGCEEFCLKLSEFLSSPPNNYTAKLQSEIKVGNSYPVARSNALSDYFTTEEIQLLAGSNMILALEYLQSIKRLNSSIKPFFLARKGAGYNEKTADADGFSSASGIREMIHLDGCGNDLSLNVPQNTLELISAGTPLLTNDFSSILHYKLLTENDYTEYLDIESSFSDRINTKKYSYTDFESFADIIKSKNITRTSVMRLLTHILLDIKSDIPAEVPYARILGFRKESEPLFTAIKKVSSIPLISKLADATINECLACDIKAADIYSSVITSKRGTIQKNEYNKSIVII